MLGDVGLPDGFELPSSLRVKTNKKSTRASDNGEEPKFTLTWTTIKYDVPFAPDGRKCRTCPRKDCDNCPVSDAAGVQEQMWWGYPPTRKTGTSDGNHCGFCSRNYHGAH